MHNSFQGGVLKGYQAWVTSGFREPAACDAARDYLVHLRGECGTLPIFPSDVKARHDRVGELGRSSAGPCRGSIKRRFS